MSASAALTHSAAGAAIASGEWLEAKKSRRDEGGSTDRERCRDREKFRGNPKRRAREGRDTLRNDSNRKL